MAEDKIFKAHPSLEVYYKTADGQPFYKEHDAKNHAKTLTDKTVKKVEKTVVDSDDELTVDEIKALAKEATDVAVLEELLKEEKESKKPRKGAIEALEKRIEELKSNPE